MPVYWRRCRDTTMHAACPDSGSGAGYWHRCWYPCTGAGTRHVGMRLVRRRGERVTRSRNEIIARMEAEAKAQNKK